MPEIRVILAPSLKCLTNYYKRFSDLGIGLIVYRNELKISQVLKGRVASSFMVPENAEEVGRISSAPTVLLKNIKYQCPLDHWVLSTLVLFMKKILVMTVMVL